MRGGQSIEHTPAGRGQLQAHDSAIINVVGSLHEAGVLGSIDELDEAVMLQQQRRSDVTDGRGRTPARVAADGEHQLVLLRGDPFRGCLLIAPVEKTPQGGAEPKQVAILLVIEARGDHHETFARRRSRSQAVARVRAKAPA